MTDVPSKAPTRSLLERVLGKHPEGFDRELLAGVTKRLATFVGKAALKLVLGPVTDVVELTKDLYDIYHEAKENAARQLREAYEKKRMAIAEHVFGGIHPELDTADGVLAAKVRSFRELIAGFLGFEAAVKNDPQLAAMKAAVDALDEAETVAAEQLQEAQALQTLEATNPQKAQAQALRLMQQMHADQMEFVANIEQGNAAAVAATVARKTATTAGAANAIVDAAERPKPHPAALRLGLKLERLYHRFGMGKHLPRARNGIGIAFDMPWDRGDAKRDAKYTLRMELLEGWDQTIRTGWTIEWCGDDAVDPAHLVIRGPQGQTMNIDDAAAELDNLLTALLRSDDKEELPEEKRGQLLLFGFEIPFDASHMLLRGSDRELGTACIERMFASADGTALDALRATFAPAGSIDAAKADALGAELRTWYKHCWNGMMSPLVGKILMKAEAGHVPAYGQVAATEAAEAPRIPKDGDPAYTVFKGTEYVGILTHMQHHATKGHIGKLVRADGTTTGWPVAEGLSVGYDEPMVYDTARGMWHAPSDGD